MAAADEVLQVHRQGGRITFELRGELEAKTVAPVWTRANAALQAATGPSVIDLSAVTRLDGSGAALVGWIEETLRERSVPVSIVGAEAEVARFLERSAAGYAPPPEEKRDKHGAIVGLGRVVVTDLGTIAQRVAFLGEASLVLGRTLALTPARIRWTDTVRLAESVGTKAIPLVMMLGFLVGMILAFQSAAPLRKFGALLYVVDLVSISVLREIGPLMTAIVVAGRSGSAFAAEIGTMKVNEEVAALTTMGLDPIAFLVVPRVLAAVVMMPVLAIAMMISAMVGLTIVMTGFGFSPAAVMRQMIWATTTFDLVEGLAKATVFGLAVALVGCRCGLAAGQGPRAVGDATTQAVVGGIVAVVLLDGMFAILFDSLRQ